MLCANRLNALESYNRSCFLLLSQILSLKQDWLTVLFSMTSANQKGVLCSYLSFFYTRN